MSDFSDLGPQDSQFKDLGPSASKFSDLGPSEEEAPLPEGPKTGDLGDEFQKPIPALQRLRQGVQDKLSEYAGKLSPSFGDIATEAHKTGKIPFMKILENQAAETETHILAGAIPTTPMEIAMTGFSGLAKGALSGEVMPEAGEMSGLGERPKPVTVDTTAELVTPKGEQMSDEALRKNVAKDVMKPLEESAIKTPENEAIGKDTEKSPAVRKSGVPPELVDSSPKLKGTEVVPSPKPEVVPGTRAWSWDVWNRLAVGAVNALQTQGQSGFSLANDIRFVRDVPQVQFGMEFAAPFEQMHNLIPEADRERVGMALADELEGKGVAPSTPENKAITRVNDMRDRLEDYVMEVSKRQGLSRDAQRTVADEVRQGKAPDDIAKIVKELGRQTRDMETGEILETSHPDWPRGGTIENIINVPRTDLQGGENIKKIVPRQMVSFVKQALSQIADRADSLGLKIHRADGTIVPFAERENYFPRMIKTNLVEKLVKDDAGVQADIARHMVKSHQSTHFSAALEQVKLFRKNILERKFGNLERAREIDLPESFYERNAFKVIPQYMRSAYQRLAEVRTFGLNDTKALAKIDAVAMEGKDADLALRTYRRFTGRDPIDGVAKGLLSGLRSFSAGAMIHFQTTLYHIPRTIYPAFEAGYLRAAKAFIRSFGEASNIEARRMGINLTQAMGEFLGEDYGNGQGMAGKFANKVMTIEGIKPLDRFDRRFAGILGKDWIKNDLVKTLLKENGNKRVRQQFMSLGLDPETIIKNKGLSDLELNTAAKRFSDRTQGNPDSTTLPLWWTSPAGKMFAQFRNFTKVITQEITAVIARAARAKDAATLARLAAGWYTAGTAVHLARKALGNKDVPYVEDPDLNYQLNSIRDGVPLPVSIDLALKALQGKKGILDFIVPPSISNVADIVGDIGSTIRQGKMTPKTERDVLRHIPIVGTSVSHQVSSN